MCERNEICLLWRLIHRRRWWFAENDRLPFHFPFMFHLARFNSSEGEIERFGNASSKRVYVWKKRNYNVEKSLKVCQTPFKYKISSSHVACDFLWSILFVTVDESKRWELSFKLQPITKIASQLIDIDDVLIKSDVWRCSAQEMIDQHCV